MNRESLPIAIKPHHFLDIIKLFGVGLETFVADEGYGHDFWRIGNRILQDPNVRLRLTMGSDAICSPCKFCIGKECVDITKVESGDISKEEWNNMIDKRILDILPMTPGDIISSKEFCLIAQSALHPRNISEIWREKPEEETKKRTILLLAGLEKYLAKYQ